MNPSIMKTSSEAIDLRPPLTPEHIRKVVAVVDVIADDDVDGYNSASTLNRQIKELRKNPELNSKKKNCLYNLGLLGALKLANTYVSVAILT